MKLLCEIGRHVSGTKKFTQTRLNVNIFKKRTSGNLTSSSKSENQQDCTTDDWKVEK